MRKVFFGLIVPGLLPVIASAADSSSLNHSGIYIGPVLEVGYEYGGDKIGTVEYTDGAHRDIRAGEGGVLAGGGHIRLYRDSPFDLRATIGYKYTSIDSRDAYVHFDRVTYELTPNVRLPYGVWAGIGVVHQSSIKLDADGLAPDLHFKAATGANFELGWRSRTYRFIDGGVALVYTAIKYKDEYGDRYDGDSIGVRFTANFGWRVFGYQPLPRQEPPVAIVPPENR